MISIELDGSGKILSWGYCMPDCPHDPIYPACTYDPVFPDFVRDPDAVDLVNYTTSYEPDIRDVVLDVRNALPFEDWTAVIERTTYSKHSLFISRWVVF